MGWIPPCNQSENYHPCIGLFWTTHAEKITKFPKQPPPTEKSYRIHFIVTGKNCDAVSVQCDIILHAQKFPFVGFFLLIPDAQQK